VWASSDPPFGLIAIRAFQAIDRFGICHLQHRPVQVVAGFVLPKPAHDSAIIVPVTNLKKGIVLFQTALADIA